MTRIIRKRLRPSAGPQPRRGLITTRFHSEWTDHCGPITTLQSNRLADKPSHRNEIASLPPSHGAKHVFWGL